MPTGSLGPRQTGEQRWQVHGWRPGPGVGGWHRTGCLLGCPDQGLGGLRHQLQLQLGLGLAALSYPLLPEPHREVLETWLRSRERPVPGSGL